VVVGGMATVTQLARNVVAALLSGLINKLLMFMCVCV
jgi:hypothetical protein